MEKQDAKFVLKFPISYSRIIKSKLKNWAIVTRKFLKIELLLPENS